MLAYTETGSGEPLLLLHGFTGTGQSDFAAIIPQLAARHRVIAPDLRGYGASQPPARAFPPDFYARDADDAAALIRALGCGPVVALGFSDGGESALLLAARAPELVRGVVAWGVCGVIAPEMVTAVERWLPVSAWGPARDAWRDEIIQHHGAAQFPGLIEGWVHAAQQISAAGGDIAYDAATQVRCPVLILHGDQDVGNPVSAVSALAAQIAQCELVILPGVGHGVHWEARDQLLSILIGWLDRI